jgi:hypothetical protein
MGSYSFPSDYTLKDCIRNLTESNAIMMPDGDQWVETIARCVRGNIFKKVNLWTVVQICRRRARDNFIYRHEPQIDVFVLDRCADGKDRAWTYRNYFEEEGPYAWDCPLSYLAMCPVKSAEWREGVLDYAYEHMLRRRRKSSLKKKSAHGESPRKSSPRIRRAQNARSEDPLR